jgi:hypothetical protein
MLLINIENPWRMQLYLRDELSIKNEKGWKEINHNNKSTNE